jgi:hypothetical protein
LPAFGVLLAVLFALQVLVLHLPHNYFEYPISIARASPQGFSTTPNTP